MSRLRIGLLKLQSPASSRASDFCSKLVWLVKALIGVSHAEALLNIALISRNQGTAGMK